MATVQNQSNHERAARSKYHLLYEHLCGLQAEEWQVTFAEIETIVGFSLPASAHKRRAWWANQRDITSRPQALAWTAAGWKTAEVDMHTKTLVFRRMNGVQPRLQPTVDEILPARSVGGWPEGLSLRREDMYEDRV